MKIPGEQKDKIDKAIANLMKPAMRDYTWTEIHDRVQELETENARLRGLCGRAAEEIREMEFRMKAGKPGFSADFLDELIAVEEGRALKEASDA